MLCVQHGGLPLAQTGAQRSAIGAVANAANPAVPCCLSAACSPRGQQCPQLCFPPGKPQGTGHVSPITAMGITPAQHIVAAQMLQGAPQGRCGAAHGAGSMGEDGAAALHGAAACTGRWFGSDALPEPLPSLPHRAQRCQRLCAPPASASAGDVGTGTDRGHLQGLWALAGEVGTGRGGER